MKNKGCNDIRTNRLDILALVSCPLNRDSCIQTEWGDSISERKLGRSECRRCWKGSYRKWKKTSKLMWRSISHKNHYISEMRQYQKSSLDINALLEEYEVTERMVYDKQNTVDSLIFDLCTELFGEPDDEVFPWETDGVVGAMLDIILEGIRNWDLTMCFPYIRGDGTFCIPDDCGADVCRVRDRNRERERRTNGL